MDDLESLLRHINEAFVVDLRLGIIIWGKPPKNHAQRAGDVAGFLCPGKGKNKTYWYIRLGSRTTRDQD